MTKLTMNSDDIKKIATLSKLQVSDAESEKFAGEFADIIGFVDKLQELDLSGVEPLEQVVGGAVFLRDDTPENGYGVLEMLKNAPDQAQNLIRVPKVIG